MLLGFVECLAMAVAMATLLRFLVESLIRVMY